MRAREVLDRTHTPDNRPLELALEGGYYVIRVDHTPLMSSATFGSEQAMARIAHEMLGDRPKPRVLVGGLGMGFTLRAVLDEFGPALRVTVAELLPALVRYSREVLGHLAKHPLRDRRVRLYEGDVRVAIDEGGWDAILLDVDNGPEALTTRSNASLYGHAALERMRKSLKLGGVLVVWSAFASRDFESRLRRAGFASEVHRVRARGEIRKGATHTLFTARAPRRAPRA
jgi:spermidine synthase